MSNSIKDTYYLVSTNLDTLFAQRRNLLSVPFIGMIRDILRFNRAAVEDLDAGKIDDSETLGAYLARNAYGDKFIRQYLAAMGSAIWSADCATILDFPVSFFLRFFWNHGLLSVSDRPQWRVIEGGSREYLEPLCARFTQRISTGNAVDSVIRHAGRGVTLRMADGQRLQFDQVVLATHSDQALALWGTGSFGKKFIEIMLKEYHPAKLIVFSRDELKQHDMRVAGFDHPTMRYFIGDVRDRERLQRAFAGVDIVVHTAALKQVSACEYNPMEAVKTNILGSSNVIDAALDAGVEKVLALSTDKAVNPINLYGTTKLAAEKLFVQSNAYAAGRDTRFSCVRYGNVVGSRGSVIPIFMKQRKNGKLTITDPRMTRFRLTLEKGVRFVIRCADLMHGGEVFVPKIPSTRILDLANDIAPGAEIEIIGIRPGEKRRQPHAIVYRTLSRSAAFGLRISFSIPEFRGMKPRVVR